MCPLKCDTRNTFESYGNGDTPTKKTGQQHTSTIRLGTAQVYIVGHIPPGSDERQMGAQPNGHTTFSEKNNLRYLQLVRKYSSIILGQFFGHLHSDSFRIIYNDNGKKAFDMNKLTHSYSPSHSTFP